MSAPALELSRHLSLLLQDEYSTSPLFVVKDPSRSPVSLPLWFAVLAELQVAPAIAIAVRNPLEVAASLKARDGFTTTKSLLLWLRHALEAEQHSRNRPRSIVLYDELLRDWQGVLAKLGADLDIKWPSNSYRASVEVENFLSEQHPSPRIRLERPRGRADVVELGQGDLFSRFAHRIQCPFSTRSVTTSQEQTQPSARSSKRLGSRRVGRRRSCSKQPQRERPWPPSRMPAAWRSRLAQQRFNSFRKRPRG